MPDELTNDKLTRRTAMISAATLAGGSLLVARAYAADGAATTHAHHDGDGATIAAAAEGPLPPGEPGRDYNPVFTPDGETLPWKLEDGVKVFHLVAGEFEQEFAPGLKVKVWGYNGRSPGPTI